MSQEGLLKYRESGLPIFAGIATYRAKARAAVR
jgi:hypothetical protein